MDFVAVFVVFVWTFAGVFAMFVFRAFSSSLECLLLFGIACCGGPLLSLRRFASSGHPPGALSSEYFGVPSSERRRTLGHLGGKKYLWHFSLALQVFIPRVVASVLVFIALSVLIVIL